MKPCTSEDAYRMNVTPSPSIGWFGRTWTRRGERQAESEATRKSAESAADVTGRIAMLFRVKGLQYLSPATPVDV